MVSGKFQPVRGTRDLLSDECHQFSRVYSVAREIGGRFGYQPVQTPILEFQDVFCKTLGDSSDIIGKEMYTFVDRGGDSLTLRPEFTAAVVRLFLCEKLQAPIRLFTKGPVFRYERPQKCRQRQFHQINYEHFGASSVESDVEIISLAYSIIQELGLCESVVLEINSLGNSADVCAYKENLLSYLLRYKTCLSEDSQRRLNTNPLRILDSKNPNDISILSEAPVIGDFYSDETRQHFDVLKKYLSEFGIPYVVNNKLVRGLDYYNGLVFEFKTSNLGSQDAVIAGGRYDNLVSTMGGREPVAAVGFAGGVERLTTLMSFSEDRRFSIVILPICQQALNVAIRLAYDIRSTGISVICDYVVVKLKAGLKRADKLKANVVLMLGDDELSRGVVSCKNMDTGIQTDIPVEAVAKYIKSLEKS